MPSRIKLHDATVARPNPTSTYANTSVLRNLDLSDINGVKTVMLCMYEHDTVPFFKLLIQRSGESPNMSKANKAVANRLLRHIKSTMRNGHDLLLLAVRRWALANNKSAVMVRKANEQLIDLAPAEVLFNPASFPAAYHAAKLKFESGPTAIADITAADITDSDDDDIVPAAPRTIKAEAHAAKKGTKSASVPTKGAKMAARSGVKKQASAKKPQYKLKCCLNCKAAHYGCDKAQPKCARCAEKNWECVYERFAGKRDWKN